MDYIMNVLFRVIPPTIQLNKRIYHEQIEIHIRNSLIIKYLQQNITCNNSFWDIYKEIIIKLLVKI